MKPIATLLALLLAVTTAHAADRPHVVFVLSDDLGPGDFGCYGGKLAPTPCIDGWRSRG